MKTKEEANKLAKTMQEIGELAGKNVTCILTSMEQPLGKAVGNTLEVIETIRALNGSNRARCRTSHPTTWKSYA